MRFVAFLAVAVVASGITGQSSQDAERKDQAPWLNHGQVAFAETCFYKGERVDGMNKICFYSCPSGGYAITVGAAQLCPINVQKP